MGLILATDMAKHAADLSSLTAILLDKGIKDGKNVDLLVVDDKDNNTVFKNQ